MVHPHPPLRGPPSPVLGKANAKRKLLQICIHENDFMAIVKSLPQLNQSLPQGRGRGTAKRWMRMPLSKKQHSDKLQFIYFNKVAKGGETPFMLPLLGIHNYLTLSPRGVSLSRNTTLTVSSPDARIIPLDSIPQRVAGLRLATTMIFLPIRSSG